MISLLSRNFYGTWLSHKKKFSGRELRLCHHADDSRGGGRSVVMSKHENFIFIWMASRWKQGMICDFLSFVKEIFLLLKIRRNSEVFLPWQSKLILIFQDPMNVTFPASSTLFPPDRWLIELNTKRLTNYEFYVLESHKRRRSFPFCLFCLHPKRRNGIQFWSLITTTHENSFFIEIYAHGNIETWWILFCKWWQERKRFFIKAKNLFRWDDDDDDDAWKGRKGQPA